MFPSSSNVQVKGLAPTFWQTKVRGIKRLLRHVQKACFKNFANRSPGVEISMFTIIALA